MLQQLTLCNFQKHIAYTIDFDPHVTVIVGDSDSGKTTLLRALRWIMLNQPVGANFAHRGSTAVSAEAVVDGEYIIRVRSKEKNAYIHEGEKFVAFGAGKVPDAISAFLRVSEVNFQRQLEGSFWLLDSPSQVAQELNAIVDLSVIDQALTLAAAEVREAKTEAQAATKRRDEARDRRDRLEWVPAFAESVAGLDRKSAALEELRGRKDRLHALLTEIKQAQALAGKKPPDISVLVQRKEAVERITKQRTALAALLTRIKQAIRQRDDAKAKLAASEKEHTEATSGRCPLCGRGEGE
jgi:exonuclease SbcC